MAEILLVRHGQANSTARDERDYDRLSELGETQSRWLGEWLRGADERFDRVVTGAMRRHLETADHMRQTPQGPADPRWNEMDYFGLSHRFAAAGGAPLPEGGDAFASQIAALMPAWAAGDIPGAAESYDAFHNRIHAALDGAATGGGRALAVTSGGVISLIVAEALGLGPAGHARLTLKIRNTSMHRLHWERGEWHVEEFGAAPHLAAAARAHARTTY